MADVFIAINQRRALRRGDPEAPQMAGSVKLAAGIMAVAFPLVIATALSLLTDIGDDFKQPFYAAISGLLPLIFIAYLVESGVALRLALDRFDQTDPVARREIADSFVGQLLSRQVWSLVVGEVGALWALASGGSSTFLAALAVSALALPLLELVRAHRERFSDLVLRHNDAGAGT